MNKTIFIFTVNGEDKYTGIFLKNNEGICDNLGETETDILEFLADGESDFIRCGNVTGYNERFFGEMEQKMLKEHGFNEHFEYRYPAGK